MIAIDEKPIIIGRKQNDVEKQNKKKAQIEYKLRR